jgi:hypothetical protein
MLPSRAGSNAAQHTNRATGPPSSPSSDWVHLIEKRRHPCRKSDDNEAWSGEFDIIAAHRRRNRAAGRNCDLLNCIGKV